MPTLRRYVPRLLDMYQRGSTTNRTLGTTLAYHYRHKVLLPSKIPLKGSPRQRMLPGQL